MKTVWVLAHGEQGEGEQVEAIFASRDDALVELSHVGVEHYGGEPVRKVIDDTNDIAIIQDGPFYSIIRPMEVM